MNSSTPTRSAGRRHRRPIFAAIIVFMTILGTVNAVPPAADAAPVFPNVVVPAPVSAVANGDTFTLSPTATIATDVAGVGGYLAGILRASTGYALPVTVGGTGTITLSLSGAPAVVGAQGYQLTTTATTATIQANQAAGLFAGVQTLLQLLPAAAMRASVSAGPWTAVGATVVDYPRFGYRGAMLDVARHFFTVAQVSGTWTRWRCTRLIIFICICPTTKVGASLLTAGLTLRSTVAARRLAAAQAATTARPTIRRSWPTRRPVHHSGSRDRHAWPHQCRAGVVRILNCDGVAPARYTGTRVGFSSLCVPLELTYTFIDQVIGEIAALTPGPYMHIGGDEAVIDDCRRLFDVHRPGPADRYGSR